MGQSLDFSGQNREENIRFLYEKAIEARNFHYDNFTKWQTFFYVAVGSVLIAYCTVLFDSEGGCWTTNSESSLKELFRILLPVLGYVFSLIWLCSSKGYTYWWNVHMSLVRRFEGENILGWVCDENGNFDKKNDKSFAVYNGVKLEPYAGIFNPFAGANFSTSKLANAMAFVSASAWGAVLMYSLCGAPCFCAKVCVVLTPMFFTWGVSAPVMRLFFSSKIDYFVDKSPCECRSELLALICRVVCAILALVVLFTVFCLGWRCVICSVVWAEVFFLVLIAGFALGCRFHRYWD